MLRSSVVGIPRSSLLLMPRRTFADVSSALPLNLGKLNHVAVAVPHLETAAKFWRNFLPGSSVSSPQALPAHGVTVVFVNLGNTKIELLEPLGEKSPIANYLSKNKDGGIHHVCIEVDNIETAIQSVKKANIRPLGEKSSIGAHGKPVIFLHPKDCNGILVELEQV